MSPPHPIDLFHDVDSSTRLGTDCEAVAFQEEGVTRLRKSFTQIQTILDFHVPMKGLWNNLHISQALCLWLPLPLVEIEISLYQENLPQGGG